MVKHGATAKSPKVLEELLSIIGDFLREFGPAGFPLKEAIEFGVKGCAHSNPKVRDSSIKMITTVYQFCGDPIRDFLKDVKDSTLKVIEDSFSKTELIDTKKFKSNRVVAGEENKPAAPVNLLDNLPRTDVSKELSNTKLIEKLSDKNWKVKKEAYDKIDAVLSGANYHIENKGLTTLMGALK